MRSIYVCNDLLYPYLFAQIAHNFFQRIACDIDHLTQEDNLPREKLWLQTKFTAIRGQDPRRVPYDPQALIGWDCLPGVAPFFPQSFRNAIECFQHILN